MSKTLADKHTVIQSASQHHQHLNQICNEFKKKFNLNCFQHIRWYKDNKKIDLCSNIEMLEWYYNEELFDFSLTEIPAVNFDDGYLIGDSIENSSPVKKHLGALLTEIFDISHHFFMFDASEEHSDLFIFSSPEKEHQANIKYMNNFDCFKNFIQHYRTKAVNILDDYQRFKAEDFIAIKPDYLIDTVNNHLITTNSLTRSYTNLHRLSRREIETLYWLTMGKTVPEIAIILERSKRTVEDFVINIKTKLICDNLVQVGQKVGNLQHHFNPLFNEMRVVNDQH